MADRRIQDKNNLIASSEWDFIIEHSITLSADTDNHWRAERRNMVEQLQDVLIRSTVPIAAGLICLKTAGSIWRRLRDEIELLNKPLPAKSKWGLRSERMRVLKRYNMTEYRFETRPLERDQLLHFLELQKNDLEKFIRDIANEFGIEIPLKIRHENIDCPTPEPIESKNNSH